MYDEDSIDIGWCRSCGADMTGEPPAAFECTACAAYDD